MSHTLLRQTLPRLALVVLALSIAGCPMMNSIKPSEAHQLDLTMYDFSSAMRWGDFDKAYDYVDPKTKSEHPLTDLERGRFKQIEVTAYTVISSITGIDMVDQQIQLGLVNRNTQIPRNLVYHEHWRWDPAVKKWWLVTGLPDISPQQQ